MHNSILVAWGNDSYWEVVDPSCGCVVIHLYKNICREIEVQDNLEMVLCSFLDTHVA